MREKQISRNVRVILVLSLLFTVTGCSWQAYNKDNPDEYQQYWQNEENRKNSILYPFTNEYEEERKSLKK